MGAVEALEARELQPLTERALARLPGVRWAWIVAWALVPCANAGINLLLDGETKSAVWGQSGAVVVLNYAALSFAVAMTIWGSGRISNQVEDLHGSAPFRELNSAAAPLVGAVCIALAFGVSALVEDGLVAAILRGTTWLIVGTALWTFLWTYVSLQIGLYRLGGQRVDAVARMDPGLGLRPVGDVYETSRNDPGRTRYLWPAPSEAAASSASIIPTAGSSAVCALITATS